MFTVQTDSEYTITIPIAFNGYNVIEYIDNGSFSAVVKVQHLKSKQYYAAKIISVKDMESKNQISIICNEIDILSSISHPNIIKIYNWFNIKNFENEEFIVIIEEYCNNGSLVKYLNSDIKNEKVIKNIEIGLINAIQYLHEIGIAHCDIKPDNVLIDENFSAKLCDFGFSKKITNLSDPTRWGTVGFNAPELYRYEFVDFIKADIWSLGITLYEISEYKFPFQNFDDAEKGNLIIVTKDSNLQIVVEKCTRIKPDERPSAKELLDEKYFTIITNIIDSRKIFEIRSKCNHRCKSYCLLASEIHTNTNKMSNSDENNLNSILSFNNESVQNEKLFEMIDDYKINFFSRKNTKKYKKNLRKFKKKFNKFEKKVKKQKENNRREDDNQQYFIYIKNRKAM